MLIGEFSTRLLSYTADRSFGIAELDEHMGALDTRLAELGLDPASRAFHLLLSFLIYQGTEWDAFLMPRLRENACMKAAPVQATLTHWRLVAGLENNDAEMIVFRKPSIHRRAIELTPTFHANADVGAVRAPATCFIACPDPTLLFEHADVLQRNRQQGQAYALLLLSPAENAEEWFRTMKDLLDPFQTSVWIEIRDHNGRDMIATLLTTDMAPYEV